MTVAANSENPKLYVALSPLAWIFIGFRHEAAQAGVDNAARSS